MLGIIKEINGQKTIVPLTTETGTGAPVGTLIQQYKKVSMSGCPRREGKCQIHFL